MHKTNRLHNQEGYNRQVRARRQNLKQEQSEGTEIQRESGDSPPGAGYENEISVTAALFARQFQKIKRNSRLPPVSLKVSANSPKIIIHDAGVQLASKRIPPPTVRGCVAPKLILPIRGFQTLEVAPILKPRPISSPSGMVPPTLSTEPLMTVQQHLSNPCQIRSLLTIRPTECRLPVLKCRKIITQCMSPLGGSKPSTPQPEESSDLPPLDDDILDRFFQKGGQGRIGDGKPAVICVVEQPGDRVFGLIETLCQRIYREKHGGNPEPLKITSRTELEHEIRFLQASNKIVSIQLTKEDWVDLSRDKESWENFQNRIDQLYSQNLGFIIINYPHPFHRAPSAHNVQVINISSKNLDIRCKRNFAELAWGFVCTDDTLETWEEIFECGRMHYEEAFERIRRENGNKWEFATNNNEDGESEEHFSIKCFIVKMLTEKYIQDGTLEANSEPSEIKKEVLTETEVKEAACRIVPDITDRENEFYEIETLFSSERQNKSGMKRLAEKIEAYEGVGEAYKSKGKKVAINIVLENITLLRHLNKIRDILKNYQKWQKTHNIDIHIWTLNVREGKLVSLQEFQRSLRNLMGECSKVSGV